MLLINITNQILRQDDPLLTDEELNKKWREGFAALIGDEDIYSEKSIEEHRKSLGLSPEEYLIWKEKKTQEALKELRNDEV